MDLRKRKYKVENQWIILKRPAQDKKEIDKLVADYKIKPGTYVSGSAMSNEGFSSWIENGIYISPSRNVWHWVYVPAKRKKYECENVKIIKQPTKRSSEVAMDIIYRMHGVA